MALLIGLSFQKLSIHLILSLLLVITQHSILFFEQKHIPIPLFLLDWTTFFSVGFFVSMIIKNFVIERENLLDLTYALSKALDSRDSYTAFHSSNVARYSQLIAQEMKLKPSHVRNIYIGALLHDIGKIGIPENILTKAGKLSDTEYSIIKQHPVIGYNTLEHISAFKKGNILDIVRHHHERYDGLGYPDGLKGEQISLEARIVGIADAYDAMTSKRIYRDAKTLDYTINEILKNSGKQFDPQITKYFLDVLKKEGLEPSPGLLNVIN